MVKYLIYRDRDISAMPLSRLRKIGVLFGIEGADAMTKGQLRPLVLPHPSNASPVPHPMIDVPV